MLSLYADQAKSPPAPGGSDFARFGSASSGSAGLFQEPTSRLRVSEWVQSSPVQIVVLTPKACSHGMAWNIFE